MRNPLVSFVVCAVAGVCAAWSPTSVVSTQSADGRGVPAPAPQAQEAVLVGAGDIANCEISDGAGAASTARLLDQIFGTVFTLGDHAYPSGTAQQFQDCYEPNWGRHKARTRPAPGNHDYITARAKPYFDYFADSAGPERRGYYGYTLGAWHVVSLNSSIPANRRSPQIEWLRNDLRENRTACTLAYWHLPVFSSGPHGTEPQTSAHMLEVWRVLYEFGADVVINGHDHHYERFALQDPKGKADPRGIRAFIVGTGGAGLYDVRRIRPNSEVRSTRAYGVLKLTLGPTEYSWEFVPGAGEQFHDTGTSSCVQ